MALPPGIQAKTVTLGIASFADGSLAQGRATVSMPVNVIHGPSNRPIFSSDITAPFVDGVVSFNLLPTDAPGLNRVDWSYRLRVEVQGATVQPEVLYFLLPTAGPDTVDLDGLVTVPSSAGVPIAVDVLSKADFAPSLLTELNNTSSATSVALRAAFGSGSTDWLKAQAAGFSFAFTSITAVDAPTGLPTAAAVQWPDGTTGTFTGTTDGTNGYTGYAVTFGSGGAAKTVTASGITYDTTTGLALGPTTLAVA